MMDRDKILKASLSRYGHKYQFKTRKAFEHGARWMEEQKQAEIDELSNKVSELTEALEASHVFCEGVKEHYIKKACNFLCDTCHASYANDCKSKPCELKTGLIEAMKGE